MALKGEGKNELEMSSDSDGLGLCGREINILFLSHKTKHKYTQILEKNTNNLLNF